MVDGDKVFQKFQGKKYNTLYKMDILGAPCVGNSSVYYSSLKPVLTAVQFTLMNQQLNSLLQIISNLAFASSVCLHIFMCICLTHCHPTESVLIFFHCLCSNSHSSLTGRFEPFSCMCQVSKTAALQHFVGFYVALMVARDLGASAATNKLQREILRCLHRASGKLTLLCIPASGYLVSIPVL